MENYRIEYVLRIITIISILCSGGLALHELRDLNSKKTSDAVLRSLEYVDRFSGAGFFNIRRSVYSKYVFCESSVDKCTATSSEVFAFVEFFDSLFICVRAKACDERVARDFFSPYADGHYKCMEKFINDVRKIEEGSTYDIHFGIGMEFFSTHLNERYNCAAR